MVTHVVFWKLKEENKGENALQIKQRIESLVGVIPGLISAQVGMNINGGEYDLALVSTLASKDALEAYDAHPAHQAVRQFVRSVVDGRAAIDYLN